MNRSDGLWKSHPINEPVRPIERRVQQLLKSQQVDFAKASFDRGL